MCGYVREINLCLAHTGRCNQSLLHCLAPARPPLAAAGSAAPVGAFQQEAQHLEVTSLSCQNQRRPTRAIHVANLRAQGDKDSVS